MGRDWESTLQSWIKRSSDAESKRQENTLKEVRAALVEGPIPVSKLRVFAKGSYANNTNVALDSDIDVAVELQGISYSDFTHDLKGRSREEFGISPATNPITPAAFKDAIETALRAYFGSGPVDRGNYAVTVRESSRSISADVIPSFIYYRYYGSRYGQLLAHQGHKIFPDRGAATINWPAQQLESGNAKNNRTGRRYKRMVRALKKLENELVEKGLLEKDIPSYLMECLVYNVPDNQFMHNLLLADMRAVLATIFNATPPVGDASTWEEVNQLKWLFRGNRGWTQQDAHSLASAAWNYVGFD
jgi:predicted nucleotidyltransferase